MSKWNNQKWYPFIPQIIPIEWTIIYYIPSNIFSIQYHKPFIHVYTRMRSYLTLLCMEVWSDTFSYKEEIFTACRLTAQSGFQIMLLIKGSWRQKCELAAELWPSVSLSRLAVIICGFHYLTINCPIISLVRQIRTIKSGGSKHWRHILPTKLRGWGAGKNKKGGMAFVKTILDLRRMLRSPERARSTYM
jgi:hypothetical protein